MWSSCSDGEDCGHHLQFPSVIFLSNFIAWTKSWSFEERVFLGENNL